MTGADPVISVIGMAGYMTAEEYRAELRRQRQRERELGRPSLRETRGHLVQEALETIARMRGEDETAAAARIGQACGIAPRRILQWAEEGPDDLDAWHRFLEVMPKVERGALARNLRDFRQNTNGELTARMAERLKKFRELQGWSEERLACHLHVPSERVREWESGECRPTVHELAVLHYKYALVPEAVRPYDRVRDAESGNNGHEKGL